MHRQQEQQLLAAFRAMHAEDRVLMIEFARDRAADYARTRTHLQLVICQSSPSHGAAFGDASSERKYI